VPNYNPQPGITWPPGRAYAEGFGGTIAAFNDLRVANNKAAKRYPSNWGGLVTAIMDLADWGNADCGVYPTGWNVLTDENGTVTGGEWTSTPLDGYLWYDESSGRLMVWNDGAFYQANGADGLTLIGANAPTREVVGGTWYNTTTNTLYLCTANGWTLLASTVGVDLAGLAIDSNLTDGSGNAVNIPVGTSTANQEDYNVWLYQNLTALQTTVSTSSANIYVQDTAPSSGLSIGNLWYKSSDNTLYVWDLESGSNQWLRAVPALTDDTNFTTLQSTVTTNNNTHTTAVAACNTRIDNLTYAPLASPTFTGTVTGPTINASTALQIGGVAITSTAAELNILDGVTATAAELNILDGVTATAAELNILDGVTATNTELNYSSGVTSNIQTQIDNIDLSTYAPLANPDFTGTVDVAGQLNVNSDNGVFINGDMYIRRDSSANKNYIELTHADKHDLVIEVRDGKSITLQTDDGSFGYETLAKFQGDGSCELFHDGNKKLETDSHGVNISGQLDVTHIYATGSIEGNYFTSDNSDCLRIFQYDGSGNPDTVDGRTYTSVYSSIETRGAEDLFMHLHADSIFEIKSPDSYPNDSTDHGRLASFKPQEGVKLFYNDSKKFETTNTGVTVTGALSIGSLPINNTDTATVGVDFSASIAATTKAFKFISNYSSANYVTWGNTSASWEYAYDFGSNEDFCWIYDNSGSPEKVFSVSKDGPACTNLTIADFSANNSSGRVLSNTIDVKDRLTKHKTALEGIRTACNDASITTVAALKTAIASALSSV